MYKNGLRATLNSYHCAAGGLTAARAHLDFFRNLPLYHETEAYIFVHAGLRPEVPLAEQDPEDLVWIREPFLNSGYDFGRTVVFGHTPLEEPLVASGRLGLDTGAVFGGPLTAAILPDGDLVMVE
jgi:serine/threonine protein phosphatase 1